MKKTLFVLVFALVLVMAVSGSAFALHSGYDATTGSCSSCHSVHAATGNHLYKSTASAGGSGVYSGVKITLSSASVAQNLCEWCHVYGTSHPVYQDGKTVAEAPSTKFTMGMHEIGATNTPDWGASTFVLSQNVAGLDCIDCHNAMPHAAKTNLNVAFYVQDAGATEADVVNAMCVRCHEGNDDVAHATTTHPLVTDAEINTAFPTSNYGNVQVAFANSQDCLACHNYAGGVHAAYATKIVNGAVKQSTLVNGSITASSTLVDSIATASTGYKFTNFGLAGARGYGFATATATTAPILTGTLKVQDTECLSCHQSGASGVNLTY